MRKYTHKLNDNNTYRTDMINILIRAANLADTPKEILFSDEPTIMENLGLTLRSIRKKNNLDFNNLALKSSCSPEIIIALEMGVLPLEKVSLHLPDILSGLGLDQNFIKELFHSFKEGQ